MSLIGLLTAAEKQVWSGRLHMRPIQWHLKRHWHIPETLEKIICVPKSLHPQPAWWLDEGNVLQGQPLHPLGHALQLFTDTSNEGWGAHLGDSTARGMWSATEIRLHQFIKLKQCFWPPRASSIFARVKLCWWQQTTPLWCPTKTRRAL